MNLLDLIAASPYRLEVDLENAAPEVLKAAEEDINLYCNLVADWCNEKAVSAPPPPPPPEEMPEEKETMISRAQAAGAGEVTARSVYVALTAARLARENAARDEANKAGSE